MQLTPVQTYKKIQAKGGHRWPVGICFFGYRAASGLSTGCSAAHFEKGQLGMQSDKNRRNAVGKLANPLF
jgi:hypothetical protein